MQIRDIEVFQVSWSPGEKPEQRSAWVRVYCDDGSFGIGEASPMQGGLASLGIVARNLAPALIGTDPLDGENLLDDYELSELRKEVLAEPAVQALLDQLWPLLSPQKLLEDLYGDEDRLAREAGQGQLRETMIHSSGGYIAIYAAGQAAVLILIGDEGLDITRLHRESRATVESMEKLLR